MAQAGYTPILIYASSTPGALPSAANLTSSASGAELAINYADGKLYFKNSSGVVTLLAGSSSGPAGGSNTQVQYNSSGVLAGSSNMTFDGTSLTLGGNPTLSAGTANGVLYLNGSKVATSGSALTFDASRFTVQPSIPAATPTWSAVDTAVFSQTSNSIVQLHVGASGGTLGFGFSTASTRNAGLISFDTGSPSFAFSLSGSEQMRLTSTGLGIGTSSPGQPLVVSKNQNGSTWAQVSNTTSGTGAAAGVLLTSDAGIQGTLELDSSGYTNFPNMLRLRQIGAYPIGFFTSDTERMRLDSSGNLGIGTSSSGAKLQAYTTAAATAGYFQNAGSTGSSYGVRIEAGSNSSDYALRVRDKSDTNTYFDVVGDGTVLIPTGNLGLGVTPSAWSGYTAFQVGNAAFWSPSNQARIYANAYFNGGDKYIASDYASNLRLSGGGFEFYTAPSGTAGNAITFTQAMTLDASGNLGVGGGATSPASLLDVATSGAVTATIRSTSTGGTRDAKLRLNVPSTGGDDPAGTVEFTYGTGYTVAGSIQMTHTNNNMKFFTGTTERARITSGGEVYIAGTTDQGAYNLQVNGTGVWGAGAYVNGSDERLKDNIQTLNDGLAVVSQLRPVTFQYKPEHSKDQSVQPGFIAQELQQTMAGKDYVDGVVKSGPEYLNVAYQNLIPILTKAIQEQQALIASLTARVALLEGN